MADSQVIGNYYDKYATKNPIERRMVGGFMAALERFLGRVEARTVLEVGCGEGVITELAQARFPGALVVGTEIDFEFLRSQGGGKVKRVVVNKLPQLCFREDAFDLVVMCEVLEHVEEPEEAVRAVREVAKRHVIISVPNEPMWRVCNMARLKYVGAFGNTPGHINHFSAATFMSILRRHFGRVELVKPFPWLMALCEKATD